MSELALNPEIDWVELAYREHDGLKATLLTLGGEALKTTAALVLVDHRNGVHLQREGPLEEVAPIYRHPMAYVSPGEAEIAYPHRLDTNSWS